MASRKDSYRLVHTDSFHSSNVSRSSRHVQLDWTMALTAYAHSIAVITVGTTLLLSLAPTFSEWRVGQYNSTTTITSESNLPTATSPLTPVWWLSSPTSYGQTILFIISATYFALDMIALYVRGRLSTSQGQRILTHHLLSIIGLIYPVITGFDGPLVLLGFVLAECSNPPFHVLTLLKYATRSNMQIRCASRWLRWISRPVLTLCLSMDLSLVHILIFVLSRLACLQFTAHAVMPFASLLSTKVTSIMLCLLSVAQFVDLCKTLQLLESSSHKNANGWKKVMSDLAQIRDSMDGASAGSASSPSSRKGSCSGDESDQDRSRRRYNKGSGGGVHSPKHVASVTPMTEEDHARKDHIKKRLF